MYKNSNSSSISKTKTKIISIRGTKKLDNNYRKIENKLGDDVVKVTYDGGRKFRTRRRQKGILKQRTRVRGRQISKGRSRGRGIQRSRRTKSRR
jgi:hypothetical protein